MPFNVVYIDDEPDICQMFEDYFSSPDVRIRTYRSEEHTSELQSH